MKIHTSNDEKRPLANFHPLPPSIPYSESVLHSLVPSNGSLNFHGSTGSESTSTAANPAPKPLSQQEQQPLLSVVNGPHPMLEKVIDRRDDGRSRLLCWPRTRTSKTKATTKRDSQGTEEAHRSHSYRLHRELKDDNQRLSTSLTDALRAGKEKTDDGVQNFEHLQS